MGKCVLLQVGLLKLKCTNVNKCLCFLAPRCLITRGVLWKGRDFPYHLIDSRLRLCSRTCRIQGSGCSCCGAQLGPVLGTQLTEGLLLSASSHVWPSGSGQLGDPEQRSQVFPAGLRLYHVEVENSKA